MYSADTGSWGPQDRSNTIQNTFTDLWWARMMTLCPCVQCLATVSWGFCCNVSGNDCVRLARQLPARPESGYQLNTESRLEAPAVRGPPVRSEASDGPGHCRHLGWGGGLGGIQRPTMGSGQTRLCSKPKPRDQMTHLRLLTFNSPNKLLIWSPDKIFVKLRSRSRSGEGQVQVWCRSGAGQVRVTKVWVRS